MKSLLHVGRERNCIVLAVLALVLMVALPAVGATEKVKLRYLTWDTGADVDQVRKDFIEPFQQLHPDIVIEHETIAFSQFWDKLLVYYASGNAPDLMHMSVGYLNEYAEMGLLLNLQPYFNRDLKASDFFAEPMRAMRYPSQQSGDLYGIPFAWVMTTLFYNKTMFDEQGVSYPNMDTDWYNVRDIGRKLAKDTNGDGKNERWGFYSSYQYTSFDPILHSFGGRILDDKYNVMLDNEKGQITTQFMVDLIHKDQIAPPVTQSGINLFSQGNMGMLVENIYTLSQFRQQASFDWDIAVMPRGPEKRVVRVWPDSFAISSVTKNAEAAWELVKYVITKRQLENKVPIYRPLALSKEWMQADQKPNKRIILESTAYSDPLEFRPRWGEWNTLKNNLLAPAWKGEVSVANALKNAADAIRGVLAAPKK